MNGLELRNLHKAFGGHPALKGVSFQAPTGKITAVLGPSGCGKSTLLGIVAGLTRPDQGQVLWDGQPLDGVAAHQRGFGLMFQDLALFPHRNVFENVAFGLQMTQLPKANIRRRVDEVLALVGLPNFAKRDVNTLSGGESQRVALARSLAPQPRLLMLDEPLGALDKNLRERLVVDLRQILGQSQQTALYVTHDQEEAFAIADQVVVMNAGRVEQIGAPQALYLQPGCEFVARFLGLTNLLPGEFSVGPNGPTIETPIGSFPAGRLNRPASLPPGPFTVLLRPDRLSFQTAGKSSQVSGVVREATFRGSQYRLIVEINEIRLSFDFPATDTPASALRPGEKVLLGFDPTEALQILPSSECPDRGGSETRPY